MNRTVRLWLLFVILVAMGGIYLYQRELTTQCERNKAMQAAVEHTKAGMARAAMRCAAHETTIASLQAQLAAAQQTVTQLQRRMAALAAAPPPPAAAPTVAAVISNVTAAAATPRARSEAANVVKQYIDGLAKLMASDALQQQMRKDIEHERVQPIYGSFLADAMLADKDEEQVRTLLVQRFMLDYGPNREFLRTDLTPAQRAAARAAVKSARATLDATIKTIIGNDDYALYEQYRDTERDRLAVAELNRELAVAGIPLLTKTQQKSFVMLMHAERMKLEQSPGYIDFEHAGPEELTPANVNNFMRQLQAFHETVRTRVEPVITAEQRDVLARVQQQYRAAVGTNLKMLSEMYSSLSSQREK
jgi:uncharacterized coiled-coil protein SlyX